MNAICFHNPDEENGYMSNCILQYSCLAVEFFFNGTVYDVSQSGLFGDEVYRCTDTCQWNDVAEIKALGRLVLGYDDNWRNGVRQIIAYEGLLAKFSPKCGFTEAIERNRKAVLLECAVKDRIWELLVK